MKLTEPTRAVVSFTLAASLLVNGWGFAKGVLANLLTGISVYDARVIGVLVSVIPLAVAIAALLLARTVPTHVGDAGWAIHLAGAARVLSVLLVVVFAIGLVAAMISDPYPAANL